MYQAGIKNITLYENIGITFTCYDPLDLFSITDLYSGGAIILIENYQRPEFEIEYSISNSGRLIQEYKLKFYLLGLIKDNIDLLEQLKTSINGWCFMVELYDGTFKFFNTPIYCKVSGIKPQKEMSFEMKMETATPTTKKHYEYVPGVSTVPIYRADTTLLRADTTIYTADYAL